MSADIIDIRDWQSGKARHAANGDPLAKAFGDPVLAGMLLFAKDLLFVLPDLPARATVAMAAIVLLDQLRDELPDDLITALEACRR